MERLQQFAAAVVAAVLAVLCMIVGILGLTVWKPAQEVVASVTPSQPLVMTRDGVLPLFGQSVKVMASAAQDEDVALVVGTPADIMGWIGTSAYTEIIGVEGGLTSLKTTDHDSTSTQAAQSTQPQSGQSPSGQSAQSGQAQSGQSQSGQSAQSSQSARTEQSGQTTPAAEAPQSGQNVVVELVSNDMWSREVSGKGGVTLDLKDVGPGQAILASTASGTAAPTITLTWGVEKANVLAVVAWVASMIFAAVALFLAYRQWRLLNSRNERAERIAARESADSTDTQAISLQEIADYGTGAEEETAKNVVVEGHDTHAVSLDEDENVKAELTVPDQGAPEGTADALIEGVSEGDAESTSEEYAQPKSEQEAFVSEDTPTEDASAENSPEEELTEEDNSDDVHADDAPRATDEATYFDAYADMVDSEVDGSLDSAEHGEAEQAEMSIPDEESPASANSLAENAHQKPSTPQPPAEVEPRVLTIGRHAANGGPIEVDPPETVPTDTGTIDLSSIRPGGAVLPSRRALREARERGVERLVIDGREFDTGLLPVVNRDGEIVTSDAAASNAEESTSSSEEKEVEGTRGGWTSLMSSWMTRNATSKEEE